MRIPVRPVQVLRRVRETIRQGGMLTGGERVVVATSGGPDSVTLLHLLCRLRAELSLRLHVVHVDHGLHRSSAAHARFVRSLASGWKVPVSVVRVNVRAHARGRHLSIEDAARELRYAALERVARRVGATHIAVAHTADDQVETVLLWLLRGAGSDGLAGMPSSRPLDGLRVIRPLIDLWRRDVAAYLAAERLLAKQDPTNRLRRPLRNRIRGDLLPRLAGYNPGVKAVLRRLALQVADDAELLERLSTDAAREAVRRAGSKIVIDVARFRGLPIALQRRVAHRALVRVRGNTRGLAFVHIERIRSMAANYRVGQRADLPGLRATRTADGVAIMRAPAG
jgi:tRNA(Ile)-lysidine synthase